MSVQVRRRRETAAFLSTFVGAEGELLVDTTNKRVQVHDGATPGGFPAARLADLPSSAVPLAVAAGGTGSSSAKAARAALGLDSLTTVGDANYTIQASDRTVVLVAALTAPRVFQMPAAAGFNPGARLRLVDQAGGVSSTNNLTVAAAVGETLNGAASALFKAPFTDFEIVTDGISKWTYDVQGLARGGTGASNAPDARANLGLGAIATQAATAVDIDGGTIDGVTLGASAPVTATFASASFGSVAGTAGTPNKIALFGTTFGFGISAGSLDSVVQTGALFSWYVGSTLRHRFSGVAGQTFLLSLDTTPIGATTASTVRGTIVSATTSLNLPSYTVATLPAPGTAGRAVFCSNARMQTASAGTLEAAGAGTGGLAADNGTAWKIAGTNINVSA